MGQGVEIEAGSAHEDQGAGLLGEDFARAGLVATHRKVLGSVDFAKQEMRGEVGLVFGGSRAKDVEIAVDQHRIRVHDHRAVFLREVQRQRRLAAGGGACDEERPGGEVYV